MAEALKPYTVEELYKAMDDWKAAKNARLEKERSRDMKLAAAESDQREVDVLAQNEARFESTVRKIIKSMSQEK